MTREALAYEKLGVSATKEDVHDAVASLDEGLFPGAFCRVGADILGGDPDYCCAQHADGAGSKSLVAYLIYKETGNARVFRGIAQDSLVMNTDDLLCIGATERFLVANTIGRNSFHISGEVIKEIVAGYESCLAMLRGHGIHAASTGGETADLVDNVRTIVVDSTVATRMRRRDVIDNLGIRPGDLIVGFSSTGQANYEDCPNSGIASNGLTLARHALLRHDYADKYPESFAPEIPPDQAYRGPFRLEDAPVKLGMTIGGALASPTRTYLPLVRQILAEQRASVHGIVHNTGGGQVKCRSFGTGILYRKNDLFAVPTLFQLIAELGKVGHREMYQTFNMGHLLEMMVAPACAEVLIDMAADFGIEAKVVGVCEAATTNAVLLETPFGTFEY